MIRYNRNIVYNRCYVEISRIIIGVCNRRYLLYKRHFAQFNLSVISIKVLSQSAKDLHDKHGNEKSHRKVTERPFIHYALCPRVREPLL